MSNPVYVIGVGMTKFEKPGARKWDYPDMGAEAGRNALEDAGVAYDLVEHVAAGWVFGESTSGQAAAYRLGLTGVPVYNVNNNCSTGSTALMLAKQLIEGGLAECTMAIGFEKMEKGSLGAKYSDRIHPTAGHLERMGNLSGWAAGPPTAQLFGNAGQEHMKRYGSKAEHFGMIAEKNHRHSAANPNSQFRDIYTLDQIMESRAIHPPLTKLQCCPTSDGGAAAVLASEAFVNAHGLEEQAVRIAGMAMVTDMSSSFEGDSITLIGSDMSRDAARKALAQAGRSIKEVDVVELHDCFSANELVTYEALGLCAEGQGGELVASGGVTYGGEFVVNPSGGLISKGHPLGATGLAQCAELTWQLRGTADDRQVEGAKLALQHNLGLGGACVVGVYEK